MAPTVLVKIPMTIADKKIRFSNEKSSFSAKINRNAFLIFVVAMANHLE